MEREEIIKMFKDLGCRQCTMLKNDPDSIIPGLLDATDVVLDVKVHLKGDIILTIFCQGILDFSTNHYAGFKDTLIDNYDAIEEIELGQLGSKAKRD